MGHGGNTGIHFSPPNETHLLQLYLKLLIKTCSVQNVSSDYIFIDQYSTIIFPLYLRTPNTLDADQHPSIPVSISYKAALNLISVILIYLGPAPKGRSSLLKAYFISFKVTEFSTVSTSVYTFSVNPRSQSMQLPHGRPLMERNRRKIKSPGGSRPGRELFQLRSHNRRSPCDNPFLSIAARQHCVLL